MGALIRAYDWAASPLGVPDQWPSSLRASVSNMLNTGLPMLVLWGPDLICLYNDYVIPSLDPATQHPAIGKPSAQIWLQAWPVVGPLLKGVLQSGEPVTFQDVPMVFYRHGNTEEVFWTFCYSPIMTEDGHIEGILATCLETTQGVRARQQLEQNQQKLLASFNESPVGIAIISREKLTFRMVNPFYGHLVGRMPDEIMGKPLLEALPELAGQGFDQLLQEVITTGKPFIANEIAVDIVRNNHLETIYVDLTYQPQREADNHISGVLIVAIDVTEQVKARQKIEAGEASLQRAIELAELGTWHIDTVTGIITCSERLRSWLGLEGAILRAEASPRIHSRDQVRIRLAMEKALERGSPGLFDEVYTITNAITGQDRIIHASGQTLFDTDGNSLSISGTAQDVTVQQQLQLALENEVQIRIEELAAINEELRATNNRLATTNDELIESTALLVRSNENLQKFAYVASHDLQEPLRKIQQFGDLLQRQYADSTGEQLDYLQRMQGAANRMSMLIKDLLNFSRIATQRDESEVLSLSDVLGSVLTVFELVIAETNARIEVDPLPQIKGDPTQLSQLFQNLLSNALKFSRVDSSGRPSIPQIAIRYKLVNANDLPLSVKPGRFTTQYHYIAVVDNGIGFDERYLDRIFQVFQRLHGKMEFTGTGIGLAVVEKVVINHGGAITASSKPGGGSTFQVYFPTG
ncbi:PAS domain-containing sensor histidine kinase [Fibrella forsythiae]|uniref:histidine kinase n=1 Tax=Fibrella forsythiae TaxID=2817061 RepID=A0ABS3JSE2_9BACT|nr:PAS domain-containing protein [Fibrella forsythiae]MBO0952932.1 PAS domain-containing protein [Fibrella forsythiae]